MRVVHGEVDLHLAGSERATANLRTKIPDFRGFDASRILILRGGVLMPIGDFPYIWVNESSRDNLSREIGRRGREGKGGGVATRGQERSRGRLAGELT